MPKQKFTKIVSERYPIPKRRGGGIIKIEAWADETGNIVKYSLAYINPMLFAKDNGRVLGYDNAHSHHHKHYFGDIYPVEDFTTYQALVSRFEEEVQEFIK